MFNFEEYWEKNGVHTDPEIIGLTYKECAKNAVDAVLAYRRKAIGKKAVDVTLLSSPKLVLKAFNKDGIEVPYAIEDGDFTWSLPEGYTLKKETKKKMKKLKDNSRQSQSESIGMGGESW